VETRGFYQPLHLHPGATERSRFAAPLRVCETFAPNGLLLPSGNALAASDVDHVITVLAAYAAGAGSDRVR
jgi:dTDP-4-amino-4,6-dideoxygalactose transaminase